jgi:hypothetical protein
MQITGEIEVPEEIKEAVHLFCAKYDIDTLRVSIRNHNSDFQYVTEDRVHYVWISNLRQFENIDDFLLENVKWGDCFQIDMEHRYFINASINRVGENIAYLSILKDNYMTVSNDGKVYFVCESASDFISGNDIEFSFNSDSFISNSSKLNKTNFVNVGSLVTVKTPEGVVVGDCIVLDVTTKDNNVKITMLFSEYNEQANIPFDDVD